MHEDRRNAHAVLVRPDFYVFGCAETPADLPAVLRRLEAERVSV